MRLLSRTLFREVFASAVLGCVLFTSVLFLYRARPLFEFLVRNSGSPDTVLYLFLLVLPQALPYTVPLGILVGTIIALSRKASDGEITAMRAAGISGRAVLPPVLAFGVLGMLAAAASSLWLTPWAIREMYRVQIDIAASQLTADIQPRVFEERFPGRVLYVRDMPPGPSPVWHQVFMADLQPSPERGSIPSVTLASEAIVVADLDQHRIQLALRNGSNYEASRDASQYRIQSFPEGDQALQAQPPPEIRRSLPAAETDSIPLYRIAYRSHQAGSESTVEPLNARIELHQRLALPFACIILALVGVPLGISSRRSGKSPAIVLTLAMAFLYYMSLLSTISLAQQESLPPELALWLPNLVFGLLGAVLIVRMEAPASRDYWGVVQDFFAGLWKAPAASIRRLRQMDRTGNGGQGSRAGARASRPMVRLTRLPLLPQVIDTYLTSQFLFYFVLWLVSFILLFHVFTFFELLSDIIQNQIALPRVFTYLFFLTPRLIYELTPVSVLVSVLVVFGVLTKNNEVTAFKACGVSVYRLTVPIFLTAMLLSGALFAFNHYLVPEADRVQDAIRSEIKGRPAQTFLNPDRRWIYGLDDKIYYYRYFDQISKVMLDVNVYEIDLGPFRLKRHISAERARWEPTLNTWIFQNGWSREMDGDEFLALDDFTAETRVFPELEETPEYFVKEAVQSQMMNFQELRTYIDELQQSGFDTVSLQVQFYKKFSVPLFALILAIVSVPFAFHAGNRGAMAGIGISFAIFILYSAIDQLFEQVGNLSQLPPAVAAWAPDAVFSLFGLYFLARLRT